MERIMSPSRGKKPKGSSADGLAVEMLSAISSRRRAAIIARSSARFQEVEPVVRRVIDEVRSKGDSALLLYTRLFDKVSLSKRRILVTPRDISAARRLVSRREPALIPAIRQSLECIRGYHIAELSQLKSGLKPWQRTVSSRRWKTSAKLKVGQIRSPIERIGVYVPGGNAILLTTALMAVTPARVAGVKEIIVASPPSRNGDIDPRILVAADLAGATGIIRAGGAQAIAAMAYGTDSVPRVHKIVGPGNVFVAAAKAHVAGMGACAIDLPAGPSEIVIIADGSANADYIARDMLSQSEHDPDASAVLVTTSRRIADAVLKRIRAEFGQSGKRGAQRSTAERALAGYGAILVADTIKEAVQFANDFAPEHLEIMTKNPKLILRSVRNAGGIFLGNYSPVAVGDYVCPNHILPTGGAARFTSGLSVDTFLKKPSTLEVPKALMPTLNKLISVLSKAEGLYEQHGKSVEVRAR
jgi:histidinol dehydrogenase